MPEEQIKQMNNTKNATAKQVLIFVGLMNLLLFIFYTNTIIQLFKFWSNSYGYSHGVLLFPILLGLYFYELYKAPKLNLSFINLWGFFCVLGLGFFWFAADLLNVQFAEFFAFWLLLILLNLFLTSDKLKNTAHLWPLLLIVFALPLWDFLSEILRAIETPMVVFALNITSIEAVRDGFLIYIPAGTFLVENACSGFNQFIVSVPLAVLYAYTRKLNFVAGCKFVFLLLLLAILFNTLRIYILVVVGQITHMQGALLHDHEYLAWLIYGTGVFILFFVTDRRLKSVRSTVVAPSPAIGVSVIYKTNSRKLVLFAFVLVVWPLLSIAYPYLRNNSIVNIAQLTDKLYWKEVATTSQVKFKPAFTEGDRVYQHKLENMFGQSAILYINYFVNQEQGREAINGMNGLVAGDDKLIAEKSHVVRLADETTLEVNESIIVLKSGEKYLVWQWYFTNGQSLNNAMDARLNNILAILKDKPAISNIVLFKQFHPDERQARKVMHTFIIDNFAALTQQL
ncbi:hypothetical protein MNBD_GAMMA23-60 [hydrothermal vent metagenome]|uniref:Methanolan biosynthesis EpsI domain-containing protein n=1 Tax=hydrothermal vent metagenome TaxID=652676 RepID=A0A3B1AWF8_9ZZZZ